MGFNSMSDSSLSQSKAILLAVQAATKGDIPALQAIIAQQRKTLRTDVILRVLLTYLPETVESSKYVPFLQGLASGNLSADDKLEIDTSAIEELSEAEAIKKIKKLHLISLLWPHAPPDAPEDPFILFLIHRAYRVDEETGLITQIPELISPFLNHSQFLRTWMISNLLPLLRLNYEYYPQESTLQTIRSFESLDDRMGVEVLLSRTGKNIESDGDISKSIGRDLRGLVAPWMYGDSRRKRRRLSEIPEWNPQTVTPLDEAPPPDLKYAGWGEVFKWIIFQATNSWTICVEAIEQWDGPGDVDLGEYGKGINWLEEHEQKYLETRYARAALAAAYIVSEASVEALTGVNRILARLIALLDLDRIPTLPAAAALLTPIPILQESSIGTAKNATYLRTAFMEDRNVLTTPNPESTLFLHGILISAYLLTRAGVQVTMRRVGELVLLQDEREQMFEFHRLIHKLGNGPKGDDKHWTRVRNEVLWLRDWGADELSGEMENSTGRGVLGKVGKDVIETELLKVLLGNTRYTLARSIYETSATKPLSIQQITDTVVSAAMNAYDNATNPNRTRGGVKKCDEIIHAFPNSISNSMASDRIEHLLIVTHSIGQYRLVLKQGEPFTPVVLRVHPDPLSLIGKILDQNPKSYTRINDFLHMGEEMVLAGLMVRDVEGHATIELDHEQEQISIAKKRITSMCIDSALTEDDFETAYSYVMNRLPIVASEAQTRTPLLQRTDSGILAHPPPRILDDWSWRAALQTGKYRLNKNTIRPTHLGNASGNLEVRHLEQRKDCLSQALRIAPPFTLHEILNVFRRCEEELDTKIKEEAEQEAAWDEQGDQTVMPGGFGIEKAPKEQSGVRGHASSGVDDAPMSLFDLTRASAAKAQNSLSALRTLTSGPSGVAKAAIHTDDQVAREHGVGQATVRKRDQLRNAAVGTLATGIGWLINAPIPSPAAGPDQ